MKTVFSNTLISWYLVYKRDLPWRNTKNPYFIWVSEVVLQQTRVEQGLSYYNNIIQLFPDIKSLAEADLDFLLKQWQGLGYYNRAINMHQAAKVVVNQYNGAFPNSYDEIRQLKGIGDYIAAAVASFAFDLPHPVCDGNVKRVISRFFAIDKPIDKKEGEQELHLALNSVFDGENSALFNQAIMDFGSLICSKSNPKCITCPMNSNCLAYSNSVVNILPKKVGKTKVSTRYIHYLVINSDKKIYVNRRKNNDIWANMFDFPAIEYNRILDVVDLVKTDEWVRLFENQDVNITRISPIFSHKLSHQLISAVFIEINFQGTLDSFIQVSSKQFDKLAIPRLVDKFIQTKPIF